MSHIHMLLTFYWPWILYPVQSVALGWHMHKHRHTKKQMSPIPPNTVCVSTTWHLIPLSHRAQLFPRTIKNTSVRFTSLISINTQCHSFWLSPAYTSCQKYKLKHEMWINPQQKIVPNKRNISSCWVMSAKNCITQLFWEISGSGLKN